MTPAERVADAIRRRRTELGLSQQDVVTRVAQAGGKLSINNFRAYEGGARSNPGVTVMADISRALEWDPDALNRIFNETGEPQVRPMPSGDATLAARLARLEARLDVNGAKLTDLNAMHVLLGCLSEEQFKIVALAVASDDRFESIS